jgi:hypothetical protein
MASRERAYDGFVMLGALILILSRLGNLRRH